MIKIKKTYPTYIVTQDAVPFTLLQIIIKLIKKIMNTYTCNASKSRFITDFGISNFMGKCRNWLYRSG